jgi:hypothetical protein
MATDLHTLTVPVLTRGLTALSTILEKARAWADESNLPHEDLLTARLIEDMGPLTMQVQRASDTAKGAAARLGEAEAPSMPDTEASFAELQERIARTIAFLESIPAEAVNGRDEATVTLTVPNRSWDFTGRSYALGFVLPNFFFHVTAAYSILRARGVPLGKQDYLGAL